MAGDSEPFAGIRNIVSGGAANRGEHVFFRLEFDDLSQESFSCPFALMPRLLGNLQLYAQMADQVRAKVRAGQIETSSPYVVVAISNSAHSDEGDLIAVQFDTTDGFPIELAMTPDLARTAIAELQRVIALAAQAPGKPRHH